jgi:hypothetical protein
VAAQAGQWQEEECEAQAGQRQEEECEIETHAEHLQNDPQVFEFVHDNGIMFRDTFFFVKATVGDFCEAKAIYCRWVGERTEEARSFFVRIVLTAREKNPTKK